MSDKAIDVLAKTHERMKTDVPLNLVKQCYEIEKQSLFDKDRDRAMDMLRQAVEDFVSTTDKQ